MSDWRADHATPLENGYTLLKEHISNVDKHALLAKRLKRTPSIVNKLKLLEGKVQLTTMNDIAGCRAIVSNKKKVYALLKLLVKNTNYQIRVDYIDNPKDSGYRSIHLIGKFKNDNNIDRPVELQIRTQVQHSWATAVEIVDLFTKQSIKSNMGSKDWTDLFKYSSELFSLFEDNPYLLSTNTKAIYKNFIQEYKKNIDKLEFSLYKVYTLCKKLNILKKFDAFTASLNITAEHIKKIPIGGYVLITIDMPNKKTFEIQSNFFPQKDFKLASEAYLKEERKALINKHFVTALVSTNAIGGVKEAYPNYFADSTKFIEYLHIINASYENLYSVFEKIQHTIKYGLGK